MLTLRVRGVMTAKLAVVALVMTSSLVDPRSAIAHDPVGAPTLAPSKSTLTKLDSSKTPIFAIEPAPDHPGAPTAIYLHGIHGRPENGCPWFGSHAFGWLVCPAASRAHDNGTFSWTSTSDDNVVVDRAESLARARGASDAPAVLVGFSQGAYVAARMATERHGRYHAIVLIGADVTLDPRAIESAGIVRVALLAGDYDAASGPMRRTAKDLSTAGVDSRFVSLGKVGHTYVPESATHAASLAETLGWVAASSKPSS